MDIHAVKDYVEDGVMVSIALYNFLPPWELFADYPRLQKAYKLLISIVGWTSGTQRSRVYGSISTKDGTQASEAAQKPGSAANT